MGLENKAMMKMAKFAIEKYLEPALQSVISNKNMVSLKADETEVCFLLQEMQGRIYVSAPVFNSSDTITRYIPLSDKSDAIELLELIKSALNNKKDAQP